MSRADMESASPKRQSLQAAAKEPEELSATVGVANFRKLARPVVDTRARFHANEAGWDRGDRFEQLGARHNGPHQNRFSCGVHAMHGDDVLGEIDADGDNGQNFAVHKTSELMRFRTSHRGTWMPVTATARITREGKSLSFFKQHTIASARAHSSA